MPAPTFLCIGAQKSGTTWLAAAVQQHPQVASGLRKELHFFDNRENFARGLEWYEEQFDATRRTRAVGEFTPNYLWSQAPSGSRHFGGAADRVADAYPDVQLIVCLRDPVDRAVSAYFHHMKAGRYPPSVGLLEAVERYPDIRDFGDYGTQLDAWLSRFALDRFLFLTYETDISPDAAKRPTLRRVFEHIGVRPGFAPGGIKKVRNKRGTHFDLHVRHASPVRRHLLKAVPRTARDSSRWTIEVAPADRAALAQHYVAELTRLEELLGRRMPWNLGI